MMTRIPARAAAGLALALALAAGVDAVAQETPMPLHDAPRTAPNVSFIDDEGRDLTLEDFRGRTVLLNLWATWCVPCVEEMPTLDALQRELGGPGFEVVALSIDRGGVEAIRAFYEKLGLGFLAIYSDSSSGAFTKLETGALPTTLLIDGEGRELGRLVGPAEWDAPEMVAFLRPYAANPRSDAGAAAEHLEIAGAVIGLSFDPVNLVLYINELNNNAQARPRKDEAGWWDRIQDIF